MQAVQKFSLCIFLSRWREMSRIVGLLFPSRRPFPGVSSRKSGKLNKISSDSWWLGTVGCKMDAWLPILNRYQLRLEDSNWQSFSDGLGQMFGFLGRVFLERRDSKKGRQPWLDIYGTSTFLPLLRISQGLSTSLLVEGACGTEGRVGRSHGQRKKIHPLISNLRSNMRTLLFHTNCIPSSKLDQDGSYLFR